MGRSLRGRRLDEARGPDPHGHDPGRAPLGRQGAQPPARALRLPRGADRVSGQALRGRPLAVPLDPARPVGNIQRKEARREMTRRAPRIAIVLVAAALWADADLAQETAIVLRANRVLDGRGAVLATPLAIVIEAVNITRIEEGNGRAAKAGAISYDLTGLTVLPGLIDGHAHLAWHFNAAGVLHTDSDSETPAQAALAAAGNAWATLAAGFTTVQSPGSKEDKDLREAIASGQIPGPRILTSFEPLTDRSGDPEKLVALVRERAAAGADLIKLFASKSIRDGGAQTMTSAQLEAACGEAGKLGLRTLVHAHSPGSMRAAVQAGCTQIEHGIFPTPEVLKLMAERGTWFGPQCCLVFRNYLDNKPKFFGIGNYNAEGFAAMERALP